MNNRSNAVIEPSLSEMQTVGRKPNAAYRNREHLTEAEIGRVLAALKRNRHGHRDWLMALLAFRHGLRVSELIALQWSDVALDAGEVFVRRLKGSQDANHYLERDEINGLRRLRRERPTNERYVFVSERGTVFTRDGVLKMIRRAGDEAKLGLSSMQSGYSSPIIR
jgi:type 1 fimbriae regulatory protein FimB/type 1 fimbriae regulatory protein FimE